MAGVNLNNVKAIVNDMVSRGAKFGSYEASKEELDKQYKSNCIAIKSLRLAKSGGNKTVYSDNKGKKVAETTEFTNSLGTFKHISDCNNKTTLEYSTGADSDKFKRIFFKVANGFCVTINDTNENGIVDADDEIYMCNKKKELRQKVSVFLGE